MSVLVWLVSYPKSGNTWLRLLLTSYLQPDGANGSSRLRIRLGEHGASRKLFDQVLGTPSSDLSPRLVERMRAEIYQELARISPPPLFLKLHDGWRLDDLGRPLFPGAATRAAIYVARNPLSIAASHANHYGQSIEASIDDMANSQFRLASKKDRLSPQLPQRLGSWSEHVQGWLDQQEMPVHLVRYEDLHQDTERAFSDVLLASGISVDATRVREAVAATRFDRLQVQEEEHGFAERPHQSTRFFRRGAVDAWRTELSPEQSRKLCLQHALSMNRLGYPTDACHEP